MGKKLVGKVAIVTGASKGIGTDTALHLAAEGAVIVVNYATSKEGAERVVNEITRNGGQAIAIQANMSKPEDIKKLFAEAIKKFKKVDILINNAGVYEMAPLEDVTPEHFHKMFDLNVLGLLLATREAAQHFGKEGGSIVNISSIASTARLPNFSVYCATKAAVDEITRCLATELGPRKIRVNSIAPGMVETEGTQSAGITNSDFRTHTEQQTPLGRIGIPKDISPAVVFLASDDASWITGDHPVYLGWFSLILETAVQSERKC